jgi:hypothetical protein
MCSFMAVSSSWHSAAAVRYICTMFTLINYFPLMQVPIVIIGKLAANDSAALQPGSQLRVTVGVRLPRQQTLTLLQTLWQ